MASTTVDPTAVVLEVLNQFTNYNRWSLAVKNYLLAEDIWDVVVDTTEPPKEGEPEFKTWRKNNARALRTIQNCCGTYHSNFISDLSSAKDAWDALANMFEPVFFEITEEGSSDATINGDTGHLELVPDNDIELDKIEDTDYNANDYDNYEVFFNDVENGSWHTAMEFLVQNPGAIRENIPNLGCTALHIAVHTMQVHIVEKLVDLMEEDDLEIKDDSGCTALHYAVAMDNLEMAKYMVEKNKKILSIGTHDGWLPVLLAYYLDQSEMAHYLYHHTPLTALKSRSGAELISQSFSKKEVDIPWDLIHRCPSLAVATDYFGHSPLNALAGMRSTFLSRRPLRFWEQWIYKSIHIEPTLIPRPTSDEIWINVQNEENNENDQRIINRTGVGSLRQLATSLLKLLVPGHYNRIYEMKLIHDQSLAFLRFMCEVTKNKNLNEMQLRFVHSALFKAVERGHIEFITHILKAYPGCKQMTDAQGMNMFQFAVECRQEKVYSLIYRVNPKERRKLMGAIRDNNNTLHLVGRFTPYAQLDHIQDAALRMQRELQWFKEVEGIVPQISGDIMNFTDNMTPHELFKKNHKELKKEAEKSMKGTATSCTVVGALIVTMMFAVAFQVPGGNNGEGIPILIHQKHRKWFMVFIVADVISLCLSTTSVIIFLGILLSRYAEVDFLKSLPTKMIFGLVTLFLSITTMMIAFSSAIYIMLEEKSGTGIPIILLGGIPVITFLLMQFRLLKEMVISTYGTGIFQKRSETKLGIYIDDM